MMYSVTVAPAETRDLKGYVTPTNAAFLLGEICRMHSTWRGLIKEEVLIKAGFGKGALREPIITAIDAEVERRLEASVSDFCSALMASFSGRPSEISRVLSIVAHRLSKPYGVVSRF